MAGFGATLFDDMARLEAVRPGLPVIAVNMAAAHVPAFALFSMHQEADKLGVWTQMQRDAFGDPFEVHSCCKADMEQHSKRHYPWVTHWHDGVMHKGSSGWAAARLALKLGFEEVILCGVPMEPVNYADGRLAWYFRSAQSNALSVFRKAIELDTPTRTRCFSMSGWTREILGEPSWLREAEHGDIHKRAERFRGA